MAHHGPIILIEDDSDDEEMFMEILEELGIKNKTIWFTNSREAFDHIKISPEQPFIIFCDINLPAQNGVDFKRRLDDDAELRKKSIPFVFYSTTVNEQAVNDAYTKMTVQGFFKKGTTYAEIKNDIKVIFDYWRSCKHPNAL
ncbi:MAG: response regulator [Chitinophagaceae bacterium]